MSAGFHLKYLDVHAQSRSSFERTGCIIARRSLQNWKRHRRWAFGESRGQISLLAFKGVRNGRISILTTTHFKRLFVW